MTTKGSQGHTLALSVFVTGHARSRLRDRFPELRKEADADLIRLVCQEISWALRDGRVAKNEPRWVLYHEGGGGNRGRRQKTHHGHFMWNEQHSRCYCVLRTKTEDGKPRVVVKTVFAAREQVAA